jgi:hypothetical protein
MRASTLSSRLSSGGTQAQPASVTTNRSRGKRSKMPDRMNCTSGRCE